MGCQEGGGTGKYARHFDHARVYTGTRLSAAVRQAQQRRYISGGSMPEKKAREISICIAKQIG